MNIVLRRCRVSALGLLLSMLLLSACLVPAGGYVGGYTEPYGHDYGGWEPGYQGWHRPAEANAARSSRRTMPISLRPGHARLRRFQHVRVGEIHDRTNARNSIGRNAVIVIIVHLFSRC
jgi:hypothetical protein